MREIVLTVQKGNEEATDSFLTFLEESQKENYDDLLSNLKFQVNISIL